MYEIKASDIQFLREFLAKPNPNDFSLELRRLLNRLRIEPIEGKCCILVMQPGKEWALGRIGTRRGDPILPIDGRRFTNHRAAEWALLKIRWDLHAGGLPLPADLAAL